MMSSVGHVRDLPVLPLRGLVVFPHSLHTLHVGSQAAIRALQLAWLSDRKLLVCARRHPTEDLDLLDSEALYDFGCLASIMQVSRHGSVIRAVIEGRQRAQNTSGVQTCRGNDYLARRGISLDDVSEQDNLEDFLLNPEDSRVNISDQCFVADIDLVEEITPPHLYGAPLLNELKDGFYRCTERSEDVSEKVRRQLDTSENPSYLVDRIATHMNMPFEEKQRLLEMVNVEQRAQHIHTIIRSALEAATVESAIRDRVKKQIHKNQREYYLNEQMKAIQRELGNSEDAEDDDLSILARRIEDAGMSQEALEKATKELNKLRSMPSVSGEAMVLRGYIDWLVSLPWKKCDSPRLDIARAEEILNEDHYGLGEVKDRILEHLAVHERTKKISGPIICLVGPPGVGKTSLARAIARAINIEFVRISLGGLRDEAEIRGHRRTYIGAMPGKILQRMAKAGVRNPLLLLDEIDKLGMDYRGDPASALLEVLDSEQNHSFGDHYLEVDYDLSQVLFICTANSTNIPPALLDRLEIIRLPGYTESEKFQITRKHLLPRQIELNGLGADEMQVTDDAIMELIRYYTREAGVRALERQISKLCRKVVLHQVKASEENTSVKIATPDILEYNGVRIYRHGRAGEKSQVGHVLGLAWTEAGGEMLDIETAIVPGKGKHRSTGCLGDVMQESIQAALTYIRKEASVLGLADDFYSSYDVHVHVPEGASPKDGPSAGIGMCTAMVSAFTGIAVRHDLAMTGEINLRGQVLPVGGLKEKLIAAHRGCIQTVIIPEENRKNLQDIPAEIRDALDILLVSEMKQVLGTALVRNPHPIRSPIDEAAN